MFFAMEFLGGVVRGVVMFVGWMFVGMVHVVIWIVRGIVWLVRRHRAQTPTEVYRVTLPVTGSAVQERTAPGEAHGSPGSPVLERSAARWTPTRL